VQHIIVVTTPWCDVYLFSPRLGFWARDRSHCILPADTSVPLVSTDQYEQTARAAIEALAIEPHFVDWPTRAIYSLS
jgi:hypothetical protein